MTSSPGERPPLSESLVGTWQLVSRVDETHAGDSRVDPLLGADPVALLIYDGSGHFAAQFMKRDRDVVALAPEVRAAAANNTSAQGGYDAYFGRYSVDDATGTVTQTLDGALAAANVGQVLRREMRVVGDRLVIRLETTSVDGEPVIRTLTWRRAG